MSRHRMVQTCKVWVPFTGTVRQRTDGAERVLDILNLAQDPTDANVASMPIGVAKYDPDVLSKLNDQQPF